MATLEAFRSRFPVTTVEVSGLPTEVVRTSGGGVPVLWLHGALGTAEIFFKQFMAWGEVRELVAARLPPLLDGRELGDFVVACADGLHIERFDLVGTSLGGYVAQWVGAEHAPRLRRLVIGNSFRDPSSLQSADKLRALEGSTSEALARDTLARIQAAPDGELKEIQLALMSPPEASNALRSRMLAVQHACVAPALEIADRNILIVECDNDALIPAAVRTDLRDAHPGATTVEIAQGGHYPYILRADAYNAAVGRFLGM